LEVRSKLTAGLLKALPGVEERLAEGDEYMWTGVFLEALDEVQFPTASVDGWNSYPVEIQVLAMGRCSAGV
jgi:hypothetical protein